MANDGTIDTKIHKTHYGRLAIASKLASGIEIQYVLDEMRDQIGDSYQRIHLLTRKYITNIKMAFCEPSKKTPR